MALLWTDGTFTTEAMIGAPRYSCAIPGVATANVLKVDYMVFAANYTPLAINTDYGSSTGFRCVGDSELQDIGGGVCKFTRTFAKVPATWTDYEEYSYSFIGLAGAYGVNAETATGRERFTETVLSKVVYDYWIADGSSQTQNGDTATITTAANIPTVARTKYYEAGYATLETDYLKDSPPYATATVPSRTTYEGYVSGGTYVLVPEGSLITRYMGQIWQRKTRYIKAL